MVLHFKPPTARLERTVRYVRCIITNLVADIERSGQLDEPTAWEATMEGALDAFAARLAADADGVAKAFELGDTLANRVRALQGVQAVQG